MMGVRFIVVMVLLCVSTAVADSEVIARATTDQGVIELVSENNTIVPGKSQDIGLLFSLAPGWHIYWSNPGDSGAPPELHWDLPSGIKPSKFKWPVPQQFRHEGLVSYGYTGQVLLPITLLVNDNIELGQTIALQVEVDWLVCQEDCLPQSAELRLDLMVDSVAVPGPVASLFSSVREQLPQSNSDWQAQIGVRSEGVLELQIRGSEPALPSGGSDVFFYLEEPGVVAPSASQEVMYGDNELTLLLKPAVEFRDFPAALSGILAVGGNEESTLVHGYAVSVVPKDPVTLKEKASGLAKLLWALVFAFIGGLLLNLMPCVFPVISLKIVGFFEQGGGSVQRARYHGLAFGAGVLVSMWLLAGLLLALRASGAALAWGFQLQEPLFVTSMVVLFTVLALYFMGLFELKGGALVNHAGSAASKAGLIGSFWSGVLAVVVATPCTAPFMGTALGAALLLDVFSGFLIFTALGGGMAFPYVVLASYPPLLKRLPQPGAWMEGLKQFMGFPLLATALWLLWVVSLQVGSMAVIQILAGLLTIGFGLWLFGSPSSSLNGSWLKVCKLCLIVVSIVGGVLLALLGVQQHGAVAIDEMQLIERQTDWEPYSSTRLERELSAGRPVLVNFTAAWCLTCQANKRAALRRPRVIAAAKARGVVLLEADWTNADPEITSALAKFNRGSVPLAVLYLGGKDSQVVVLPTVLTEGLVLKELGKL